MEKYNILEHTKDLLVKSTFVELLADEIKQKGTGDPYTEDILYSSHNNYSLAASLYLSEVLYGINAKENPKNSEEQIEILYAAGYFNSCIEKAISTDEKQLTELLIRSRVLNDNDFPELVRLSINEINSIKDEISQCDWLKIVSFIPLKLDSIANRIKSRFNDSQIIKNEDKKTIKIKYNAGVASLGTLFYELLHDQKTSGNLPFIQSDIPSLINFIHSNFVDSEGMPFDQSSIVRYLQGDKTAKRNKADVTVAVNAYRTS